MGKRFTGNKNKQFDGVELSYSCLAPKGLKWFCRVWHKEWLTLVGCGLKEYGEGYGSNKFEAYRNAVKNLRHD